MDNYRNFSVPVKKRRGNVFLKVIMLLCVIVIVSITALYVRDGTAFDRLREDVITQKEEDEEGDGFKVNWDKIKNKDAVAWIRFKSMRKSLTLSCRLMIILITCTAIQKNNILSLVLFLWITIITMISQTRTRSSMGIIWRMALCSVP